MHANARELKAPETLGLETRAAFRQLAEDVLEHLPQTTGVLVIDFLHTVKIDSAGLGALLLAQRKAAERGQGVVLRNLKDEFRFLLALTRLDDLFEIEPLPR